MQRPYGLFSVVMFSFSVPQLTIVTVPRTVADKKQSFVTTLQIKIILHSIMHFLYFIKIQWKKSNVWWLVGTKWRFN